MPLSVVFSGYAPVHFLCFRPLYQRLRHDPRFEIRLSGGLKRVTEEAKVYDTPGLYDRFDVDPAHVLPVPAIKERDFDVLFSAHTKLIRPRSVGTTVQIFHGVSFRNRAIRPANMKCDHYFLVGPYMT